MTRESRWTRRIALVALMGLLGLVGCESESKDCPGCGDALDPGCEQDADTQCPACDAASSGDTGAPVLPPVVINEVVCQPPTGANDWFELMNLGSTEVDVGGLLVADELPVLGGYRLPAGTVIPAGGFLVVHADGEGSELHASFKLSDAEAVGLYMPDGQVIDEADWGVGDAPQGASWGRDPDGTGDFRTLGAPTPGTRNTVPE